MRQELIIVPPRECPKCTARAGTWNCDYRCPACDCGFCSQCYKTDPSGPGDYVFCPVCGTKLFFPDALQKPFSSRRSV